MTDIRIMILSDSMKKPSNRAKAFVGEELVAEVEVPSKSAPICALCRELLKKGYAEDDPLTITREGKDMLLFKPTTVGYWASKMITEGEQQIRLIKYREFSEVETKRF